MTLATAPAADERPVPLRARPDLTVCPQWFRGQRHWLVKDPLSLSYFHLLDEEYALLQLVDGRASLAEIQQQFEARFAPQRLSLPRLQNFLGDLHRRGLLLADSPASGATLLARRDQRQGRRWAEVFGNLLALRLPGVNPASTLNWLTPHVRGLFSRFALLLWLVLAVSAAVLAAVQCDTLLARLPNFRDFFAGENLLVLVATMAGIKVLHELGHGVACRHFGGECQELGLMFLVFTPSLYCDVSDAWTLPNKWHRMAISAAGMYVEIWLAALATFLWWWSEPGVLNSLCLNTMFVCSVSTVLFNGNPLLRFDGYYIFADLIEVPNLQARARAALSRLVARWGGGVDFPGERSFTERGQYWLASYALASMVYRWVVVVGTFFFLTAVLKPYHLELVAQLFMLAAVAGMLAVPAWQLSQLLFNPLMNRQIKRRRVLWSSGLGTAVAVAVLCLPWPGRVRAPLVLQPAGAQYVYVAESGTLEAAVQPGKRVVRGAQLARLSAPDIDLAVARVTSERNQQRLQIRHLEARRITDPEAAAQLPAATQHMAELDEQLQQLQQRAALLILRAPADGVVLAPPRRSARQSPAGRLAAWTGTPLDPENHDSYLEAGTLFCLVGDPDQLEALALIDQADVEFVQPGQRVRLLLNQRPTLTLTGTVAAVAKIDWETESRQPTTAVGLASRREGQDAARPLTTAYQVRIALDGHDEALLNGAPGRAKITVAPQSLGQRLLRYVSKTFHFQL